MKAVWLIVVVMFLYATWCNLEQAHRITDLEVRARDLEKRLLECR